MAPRPSCAAPSCSWQLLGSGPASSVYAAGLKLAFTSTNLPILASYGNEGYVQVGPLEASLRSGQARG